MPTAIKVNAMGNPKKINTIKSANMHNAITGSLTESYLLSMNMEILSIPIWPRSFIYTNDASQDLANSLKKQKGSRKKN